MVKLRRQTEGFAHSLDDWSPHCVAIHQEDGSQSHATTASPGSKRTRSGGTSASNLSVSTSGSVGSPSIRDDTFPEILMNDLTFSRLNQLDRDASNTNNLNTSTNKKGKYGQRIVGLDKSGRGLRQFSMKVCEKVESRGSTTYNEVADELVAEFSDHSCSSNLSPDQQYDEKNIRRRVYDALNVLMALEIISKDKKQIHWRGLPHSTLNDVHEMKAEELSLRSRIEKKFSYLHELEEQIAGVKHLISQNEERHALEDSPRGGVSLPFILVQTRPHATVEVEISEDMQLVHFDFNNTPFELHDDSYVLKAMNISKRPESDTDGNYYNRDDESNTSVPHEHFVFSPAGTADAAKIPNSPLFLSITNPTANGKQEERDYIT